MGWTMGVRQRVSDWRRSLVGLAALGLLVGTLSGLVSDESARALPQDANVAIKCYLAGNPIPIDVPAFACPSNDGWYLHYLQPLVLENGSLGDDLEATLMAVMAIGGRGQPAYNPPITWNTKGALYHLSKVKNPTSEKGPVDYVKEKGAEVCKADPGNIALIARIGYVLASIAEPPSLPECDIVAIVKGAYNPGTGGYGPNLASTIWASYMFTAQSIELEDKAKTIEYIKNTNHLESGGWSSDGTTLDPALTARAIMALLGLDEDPLSSAIDGSFDVLAAAQNEDGGWSQDGQKTSCTIETALVHGSIRASVGAGGAKTIYQKFKKGSYPTGGSPPTGTGGRMGIEWPLLWEGLTYQNAGSWRVYIEPDWNGRFVTCWGRGEESDYATLSEDELKLTTPTSTAVYYAHFYDPILDITDEPVGPGGGEDVTAGAAVTPAVAQPSVTG